MFSQANKHAVLYVYMCMQVGRWEGMCYMQLSPGVLEYRGGTQMSQVPIEFNVIYQCYVA